MRFRTNWQSDLKKKLIEQCYNLKTKIAKEDLDEILAVELGLSILNKLNQTDPQGLWYVLSGYLIDKSFIDPQIQQVIVNGRLFVGRFASKHRWLDSLETYKNRAILYPQLALYRISEDMALFRLENPEGVLFHNERILLYDQALLTHPESKRVKSTPALPGEYYVISDKTQSVKIPADFGIFNKNQILPPCTRTSISSIKIPLENLVESAIKMDRLEQEHNLKLNHWEDRWRKISLKLTNNLDESCKELDLDDITHIVGVVGSGKSTLIQILTFWAVQHHLRCAIILGDVGKIIETAHLFNALGMKASPIVGQFSKLQHKARIDRKLFYQSEKIVSCEKVNFTTHPAYEWLDYTCLLNGFQGEGRITKGSEVCAGWSNAKDPKDRNQYHCPFINICGRYKVEFQLNETQILLMTPASLMLTKPMKIFNPQEMTYLEYCYQYMDLVLVDEIDRVQINTDNIFANERFLTGLKEPLSLDRLILETRQSLVSSQRRGASRAFERWNISLHDTVTTLETLISRIGMDNTNYVVQKLKKQYINPILLYYDLRNRILKDVYGGEVPETHQEEDDPKIVKDLYAFVSESVSHMRFPPDLRTLFLELRTIGDPSELTQNRFVDELVNLTPSLQSEVLFFLLFRKLDMEITQMNYNWRSEFRDDHKISFDLENFWLRVPQSYAALLPHSGLGRYFGYRFFTNENGDGGELKIIMYPLIGRYLWHNLPTLFLPLVGTFGPNLVLFSATSWMPLSTKYHIQITPKYLLSNSKKFVNAMLQSEAIFYPVSQGGKWLAVSGTGDYRDENLTNMVRILVKCDPSSPNPNYNSLLERILDDLPVDRQRLLLVVGSYDQSKLVESTLLQQRPEFSETKLICRMESDSVFDTEMADHNSGVIFRSEIESFATTDAQILIAPTLAIERGHNILNIAHNAAIGAVLFLVRPMPHPDDVDQYINYLNETALNYLLHSTQDSSSISFHEFGVKFRSKMNQIWNSLFRPYYSYQGLSPDGRNQLLADIFILLWQIVGRSIRGEVPTKIFFVDAAFMQNRMKENVVDNINNNLLLGLQKFLEECLSGDNPDIVLKELYFPFFQLLQNLKESM